MSAITGRILRARNQYAAAKKHGNEGLARKAAARLAVAKLLRDIEELPEGVTLDDRQELAAAVLSRQPRHAGEASA